VASPSGKATLHKVGNAQQFDERKVSEYVMPLQQQLEFEIGTGKIPLIRKSADLI
jgi:hypothetical protein